MMRSMVIILAIFLQWMLHLGVTLKIITTSSTIESMYKTGLSKKNANSVDWGCGLSKKIKITACQEILSHQHFSQELNLKYSDIHDDHEEEFECGTYDLMLTSDNYFGEMESQEMIMCPTCLQTSDGTDLAHSDDPAQPHIMEEFYYSKSFEAQSVFVYSYFKPEHYFVLEVHISGLRTPLHTNNVEVPQKKAKEPLFLWPILKPPNPITGYEIPEFAYNDDHNQVPKIMPKSEVELLGVV